MSENEPLKRVLQLTEYRQFCIRQQLPERQENPVQSVIGAERVPVWRKAVEAARRNLIRLLQPKP